MNFLSFDNVRNTLETQGFSLMHMLEGKKVAFDENLGSSIAFDKENTILVGPMFDDFSTEEQVGALSFILAMMSLNLDTDGIPANNRFVLTLTANLMARAKLEKMNMPLPDNGITAKDFGVQDNLCEKALENHEKVQDIMTLVSRHIEEHNLREA